MRRLSLLLFSTVFLHAATCAQHAKVRIACVGNSITYGYGAPQRDSNSYPAQLQALLGSEYEVRNFGKSGATLIINGDLPYTRQAECRQALEYRPDLVFIELGTNDSKPHNRIHLEEFEKDYAELINSFRDLPGKPRIVLLLPPPAFTLDSAGITDAVMRDRIIPRIQSVAFTTGCEVVNLYNCFVDAPVHFPDQIHPSSIGLGMMATRIYDVVRLTGEDGFDVMSAFGTAASRSSYYGFDCFSFSFEGREARIVKPKKSARGHPWIWRARFWGHEPQTEIALLERGFHVVYCDVAELFGNDAALGIWGRFYDKLVKGGLSHKAVLEGLSRGGVYIYRWAAAHPDRVACVYADAPVLDLKSWPGGKGKSHGNPGEWERFKADFGLKTETEALAFRGNPLDLAGQIARGGYPMLHVCGDADDVVPVEENTDLFEKEILAHGGTITVIHKPGVGHHPHSLANPEPIVDFILRATGQKTNFATIPAPGNEYRTGAGWKSGVQWHSLFDEMNRMPDSITATDILFLGNSITQGIGGKGRSITSGAGDSAFNAAFRGIRWLNFGISGDRTQHILWRVQNGTWPKLNARLIVLSIGVNNFPNDSGEEVAEGIGAIVEAIKARDLNVRILLGGPLPAKEKTNPIRRRFETVHALIGRLADGKRVFYSNLAFRMLTTDGGLDGEFFAPDGIHLTRAGYREWATLLAAEIARLKLLEQ